MEGKNIQSSLAFLTLIQIYYALYFYSNEIPNCLVYPNNSLYRNPKDVLPLVKHLQRQGLGAYYIILLNLVKSLII